MRNNRFDAHIIDGTDFCSEEDFGPHNTGKCNILGAVLGGALGLYTARQQRKATEKAAAQQQQGIAQAQQESTQAAQEASRMLQPLASMAPAMLPGILQGANQYGQLGQVGQMGLLAQAQPLNVGQFLNPMMQQQMDAGRAMVESSAAARGGLLSGATLQSLQRTGSQIAANNFASAAELALRNRQQQLGLGSTLSGFGDTALNIRNNLFNTGVNALGEQANLIAGTGANNANLAMTSGNVAARATASMPDALGSALQGGISGAMMGAQLAELFSDAKKKYNVEDVEDDEIDDFLEELAGKTFEYKVEAKAAGAPEGRYAGVMAQDMEKSKMGKQLVKNTPNGKQVDVPMTVSALLATNANLAKRVKKLEGKK